MQNFAGSSATSIVIGVLVVAFICYRQVRTRTVREERGMMIFFVLLVIGLYEGLSFMETHSIGAVTLTLTIVSLIVGLGFGLLRGALVHIWRAGGKLLQRGNAWTIVLWIVGLGIHLAIDLYTGRLDKSATGFGGSTVLVYIALSLGAQRLLVQRRAKTVEERPDEAAAEY